MEKHQKGHWYGHYIILVKIIFNISTFLLFLDFICNFNIMITIKCLPANIGDSILLSYNNTEILIDTGTKRTYKTALKDLFKQLIQIDLLILTHIDEDHIGGILKYYDDQNKKDDIIKKVWFNSSDNISNFLNFPLIMQNQIFIEDSSDLDMSVKQGITLEKIFISKNILNDKAILALSQYEINKGRFTILSPDIIHLGLLQDDWGIESNKQINMSQESDYHKSIDELCKNPFKDDTSLANKTSIAFLFEYDKYKLLFLGDSSPMVVKNNLIKLGYNKVNKLSIDVIKVSHHGSKNGISNSLLELITCTNYIISTDGSNGLPDKEALAKIITSQEDAVYLHFNYYNENISSIFSEEERKKYNFIINYLNNQDYTLTICE